jgi:guanosine-3',5'-bis(diphosphate) 3'-pyrophosphohydrolase
MTSGEISITEIIRCSNFAAIKHKIQRRKDPESTPYINHPIGDIFSSMLTKITK